MSDQDLNQGVIDEIDWNYDENNKTKVCVKQSSGNLFIDVRKWHKNPNEEMFRATSKGIMLRLDQWPKIVSMISKMVDDNRTSKA